MLFSSRHKFSTKWGCHSKSPSLSDTSSAARCVLNSGMGASTGVSAQQQAGRHVGGAPALPPHIRGTLHGPAHGKVARTDFFVLSKGDLHSSRTLEKELSLLDFQAHWWGKARSTTLGWTLLPQPHSVWAAHLPTAYLRLGLVREDFAGAPLPDPAPSPTPSSNKYKRKSSRSVSHPEKTLWVHQCSTAKIPLEEGGDRVLQEVHQYQWPPHLCEHVQNVHPDKRVLAPHPKKPWFQQSTASPAQTLFAV